MIIEFSKIDGKRVTLNSEKRTVELNMPLKYAGKAIDAYKKRKFNWPNDWVLIKIIK